MNGSLSGTGARRRAVLAAAGAAGAAGMAAGIGAGLGGCRSGGGGAPDGGGTGPLADTSDIPVGGGRVFPARQVVVTQPSFGVFRAFSAVCTHQGCLVSTVADGTINCPCHGSRFSVSDGSVVRAAPGLTPQTQNPLPARTVTVQTGKIIVS